MEFPQFAYTDYIVSQRRFFKKYIVVDEYRQSRTVTVIRAYKASHTGVLKPSQAQSLHAGRLGPKSAVKQTIVLIKKMPFICDARHLHRFEALIKAWKSKLVLASRI